MSANINQFTSDHPFESILIYSINNPTNPCIDKAFSYIEKNYNDTNVQDRKVVQITLQNILTQSLANNHLAATLKISHFLKTHFNENPYSGNSTHLQTKQLLINALKNHASIYKALTPHLDKTIPELLAIKDHNGYTALDYVILNGNHLLLQLLLSFDTSPIYCADNGQMTPFLTALQFGTLPCIKAFVDSGRVDLEDQTYKNYTPLIIAIQNNRLDVVKFLIEKNVDLNKVDAMQNSVLNFAAKIGFYPIISYLIEKNANFHSIDAKGNNCTRNILLSPLLEKTNQHHLMKQLGQMGVDTSAEQESIRRKNIAHIWGLNGRFSEKNISLEYDGYSVKKAAQVLAVEMYDFLERLSTIPPMLHPFFSPNCLKSIKWFTQELMDSSSSTWMDVSSRVNQINNQQLSLIQVNWSDHVAAVLLFEGMLFKCNRGYKKDEFPVMGYIMHNKMTDFVLASLCNIEHKSDEQSINYFKNLVDNDLKLEKQQNLCFQMQNQYAGNCTLASLKSAFYALLQMLARTHTEVVVSQNPDFYAKEAYKLFTSFKRYNSLKNYLQESPEILKDRSMIRAVKEKTLKKLFVGCISEIEYNHYYEILKLINDEELKNNYTYEIRPIIGLILNEIQNKILHKETIHPDWITILKYCSDVNFNGKINDCHSIINNRTLLVHSIYLNSNEIYEFLIAHDADVNQVSGDGYPPIFHALTLKNDLMIQKLVNHPLVNLDAIYNNTTARIFAASIGYNFN